MPAIILTSRGVGGGGALEDNHERNRLRWLVNLSVVGRYHSCHWTQRLSLPEQRVVLLKLGRGSQQQAERR